MHNAKEAEHCSNAVGSWPEDGMKRENGDIGKFLVNRFE